MDGSRLTHPIVRLSLTRMLAGSVAVLESSGWALSNGIEGSTFSATWLGGSGLIRSSLISAMAGGGLLMTHAGLDAWVVGSSYGVTSARRFGNSKADLTGGWRAHEAVGDAAISGGRPQGD